MTKWPLFPLLMLSSAKTCTGTTHLRNLAETGRPDKNSNPLGSQPPFRSPIIAHPGRSGYGKYNIANISREVYYEEDARLRDGIGIKYRAELRICTGNSEAQRR